MGCAARLSPIGLILLLGCAAQPAEVVSSPPVPDPPRRHSSRPALLRPPPSAMTPDPKLDDVERELRALRDRLATKP